jgi:hypothetical protein
MPTLLDRFERLEIPPATFSHARHVEVAFDYLNQFPFDEACQRFSGALQAFAAHAGAVQKYHHTITIAWLRLVAAARQATPGVSSFEEFAQLHPWLFTQGLVQRFFSPELLASADAKAHFVEPDLAPLPRPIGA